MYNYTGMFKAFIIVLNLSIAVAIVWHNPRVIQPAFAHSYTTNNNNNKVLNTYHPPQSIGAGMLSSGGWKHTPIVEKNQAIQAIIDTTAFFAGRKSD